MLDFDTSKVDWKDLSKRAVYRHPPFESGETEKGFRDSLIGETFIQLVHASPVTPHVCLLAIVTSDRLLTEYISEKTRGRNNVRVFSNISELESLINTLVSQVTEEFVAELSEKVQKYFFEEENQAGLVFKEKVIQRIKELYEKELGAVPKEGTIRENGTWRLYKPIFVKKYKQRTYWISTIEIDTKLLKYEYPIPATSSSSHDSGAVSTLGALLQPLAAFTGVSASPISGTWEPAYTGDSYTYTYDPGSTLLTQGAPKKVELANGKSTIEIHWSVNITQRKILTKPSIDEIRFVSTKWSEE
jgi:hypothetical protein